MFAAAAADYLPTPFGFPAPGYPNAPPLPPASYPPVPPGRYCVQFIIVSVDVIKGSKSQNCIYSGGRGGVFWL